MERYWVSNDVLLNLSDRLGEALPRDKFTPMVKAADAQATIAALHDVIKQMGEQAAVIAKDAMAAKEQVAALQARVQELEEWKHIVTGAGTDQESVIRLAAYEYTKIAVQCWKEANAKLESQLTQRTAERDALKLVNDTHMKTVMKLSHVVEQRTAELERVRALVKTYADAKIDFDDKRLQEDHHAWRERYTRLVGAETILIALTATSQEG